MTAKPAPGPRGRPALPPDQRLSVETKLRMTAVQAAALEVLGGQSWIRAAIDWAIENGDPLAAARAALLHALAEMEAHGSPAFALGKSCPACGYSKVIAGGGESTYTCASDGELECPLCGYIWAAS